MWITTPKTEKVLYLLHGLSKREGITEDEKQALFIADYIIQLHRKETESAIKNSIEAVRSLSRFGVFLKHFVKIREEIE